MNRKRLCDIRLTSLNDINNSPDKEHSASCADLHALNSSVQEGSSLSSSSPAHQSALSKMINSIMVVVLGNGAQNGSGFRVRTLLNILIVALLFFATLADVAFWSTNQLSSLSVPLYYDALSPDVISPPFHYRTTNELKRSRTSLGSAMIGSVTDVLSPILPFAGGVDLRRDENWGEWLPTWIQTYLVNIGYSSSISSGESVNSIPRGGSTLDPQSNHNHMKTKGTNGQLVFSTSAPFVSVNDISQMSLGDVALIFKYAVQSSHANFDRAAFISHGEQGNPVSDLVKKVIDTIDMMSSLGRGENVLPSLTHASDQDKELSDEESSIPSGETDALKFCAAMRILTEWRILRQVPDGYKGYAVGMSLGHKDVVQNLGKIEAVIRDWITAQNNLSNDGDIVRSPTLRQLLQHEIDKDIHPTSKLPRLKEKSAGMGLLWVRRQLHYQTEIFANVLNVPSKFTETRLAVSAAYTEVYGQFHGWAVQKIFNYSFQAAPQATVIYRHMNPRRLHNVLETAKSMKVEETEVEIQSEITVDEEESSHDDIQNTQENDVDTNIVYESALVEPEDPLMDHVNYDSSDSEIPSNDSEKKNHDNVFLKLGGHIASEWDKMSSHVHGEFEKVVGECDKIGKHVGDEWNKFGKHVVGEWDKIAFNVGKIFDNKQRKKSAFDSRSNFDMRGGATNNLGRDSVGMSEEQLNQFIDTQMEIDAHQNIKVFLNIAKPLLKDLEELFSQLNMDDPTKV